MDVIHSLGFRTDVMLLELQGSSIEEHDGYRVVRTPANPTYHWGNFLLLAEAPKPGTVAGWLATFQREFPGAGHVSIGVDGTEGRAGVLEEIIEAKLTVDRATVLTSTRLSMPERGYLETAELRMLDLDSDDDWAGALALQHVNYPPTEADGEFAGRKLAALRELQARGLGGWFGAFIDGALVSGLGIFSDRNGVARFQTVDTHPEFRTRGLAGSLVQIAGDYALASLDARTLVIVADPDFQAVRLYQSVGFRIAESMVQLYNPVSEL